MKAVITIFLTTYG